MPLDLVGKLHRTVYIEGCPSSVREDLLRLLVTKCGAVEGWDAVGERLVVVFSSMNSISTAITFNGTAFGDLARRLFIWVATESPPAGAAQQMTIADKGAGQRSAADVKSAREARERRRAAIRAELAPEIERAENVEARRLELCVRQLRALVALTRHALGESEKKLEELTTHRVASERLVEGLRAAKEANGAALHTTQAKETFFSAQTASPSATAAPTTTISAATVDASSRPGILGERDDVARRVEAMVAEAEDIGQWRKRSREKME